MWFQANFLIFMLFGSLNQGTVLIHIQDGSSIFFFFVNNHRNVLMYIFMVFFYCDSFHYICLGAFLACVYEYHMCALCCQRSEKGIYLILWYLSCRWL